MTGSHNFSSPSVHRTVQSTTGQSTGAVAGPYARPFGEGPSHSAIDAVLIDAIRASAGPYVPAPFRGKPSLAANLPWIDAFIDTANPMPAGEPSAESGSVAAPGVEPDADESWLFDDAGETIRSLADELSPGTIAAKESSALPTGSHDVGASVDIDALASALHAPLPMWRDDDLMDIMPVQTPIAPSDGEDHWAARARRETAIDTNAATAASLLEAVAGRIRDGSLVLSNTSANMSEAAALSATLTALLNSRD